MKRAAVLVLVFVGFSPTIASPVLIAGDLDSTVDVPILLARQSTELTYGGPHSL
jgi:hypothetical protein